MENKKFSSVIDIPKQANEKDAFGIEKYTKGLISFIENTATPITIALQGEWGSGKTSLMNTLKKELCDDEGKRFYPVWINTWQFSLMKDANETLVSIIKGLTEEVISLTENKNSDNIKKLSKVFGRVFRATAKIAVNAATGQDIGEVIDAFSLENKEVTVLQMRDALNDAMNDIIKEGKKDGFIFFIDDLDRVDPPVAVEILELLKNIFDLENCVFILAIDYDVIIKGLEPKFGKFTEKNEREFRSFFDKIIQLPFSMPVANYNIDDFLVENLQTINYLNEDLMNDKDFKSSISEITRLSVGSNPRALKRLLNSLSLINNINKEKNEEYNEEEDNNETEKLEKTINFALVNIQIAYPKIYSLLAKFPNFPKWDDKIAIQMNLDKIDDDIVEKLNVQKEFDEVWEQILFRVCEKDFYLKKNALNISRLLNSIRSIINIKYDKKEEDENKEIGKYISSGISLSSVTSLEAFDNANSNFHANSFLKEIREKIISSLEDKMQGINIEEAGIRVVKNAKFVIEDTNCNISAYVYKGLIEIEISIEGESDKKGNEMFENLKTDHEDFGFVFGDESFDIYLALKREKMFFEDNRLNEITDIIKETYNLIKT